MIKKQCLIKSQKDSLLSTAFEIKNNIIQHESLLLNAQFTILGVSIPEAENGLVPITIITINAILPNPITYK